MKNEIVVEPIVIEKTETELKLEKLEKDMLQYRNGNRNSNGIKVTNLFQSLGVVTHKDRFELSGEILKVLITQNKTKNQKGEERNVFDILKEVNLLIYHIKNHNNLSLGKVSWWKTFEIEEIDGVSFRLIKKN